MCGIAGIINHSHSPAQIQELLTRMLSRISHRGPDESGIYLAPEIGLGHVRLSIIDLTTGQQPMHTSDNSLWIVFNGEIFNYKELREELLVKGYLFRTSSDTEVLLTLYRHYGEECLKRLNGQFTFAIWDNHKQELFIARDRIGIRPLFYYCKDGCFVFASEIKSILEYQGYSPEINTHGLSQLFTFWTNLTPSTCFKNILELPPGHYLKFRGGQLQIYSYWALKFKQEGVTRSFYSALEEFGSLLEDAVNIRLRADVPVAAYLSGGLDSSATTAIIKKIVPNQLQTFSIGFSDLEYDETPFQQEVSNYLKTQHKAFSCNSSDISSIFPTVIWHTEIPLTRTAPAPMFLLSKKVRENNIKVVITGEGADEMLAGYDIFKETLIRQFWSRQPQSNFRPLLLKKLYPYIPQISSMNAQMLRFVFGYKLEQTYHPFYSHLLRWHNAGSIQRFLIGKTSGINNGYDPAEEFMQKLPSDFNTYSNLEKAQWIESTIFLSGYLLSSQGDRMAMANSVEGRYPFLDYRVMEFCTTLPDQFKMNGLNEKYILKQLMKNRLPESILKRPKQAYRAPIVSTFITNPPEYLPELLNERAIKQSDLFEIGKVNMLFNRAKEGKTISEIDAMAITGIISTQLFYKLFFENDSNFKPALKRLSPRINQQSYIAVK